MNKISINNTGKIDPLKKVSSEQPKTPEKSSESVKTFEGSRKDSVELSGAAKEAANLSDRIKELPDVRSDLVTRFQDLVEKGEYEPAGELIAEAILREEF